MSEGLGEFGRIRRFFAPLAGPGGLDLRDDAALLACGAGRQLVVTVDAIVAGVHYLPDDPPDLVARKLLRVNLSDLAAMGARPRHYLLTTALPAALDDDWVARFAAGLGEDQRRYGIDLLCGDSQVGASVALPHLPLSVAAKLIVAGAPDLPARLATAGDDYELLFTAPPDTRDQILRLAAELRLPITAIGTIESGAGVRLVD